ncbi:hypothetical protein DEO72_LG5g1665 [Vigna unguiculata]|uniref:Uncharacterized protein n=1 Tax=Vigna unguiculata TaxID=3917 RepID=A0A4D6LYH6_VIGUN|nr:hypothetical protein DEO72_LG5g1665 [Vigna unguiculata]
MDELFEKDNKASPAPPASTSSAHVYRAHDHRQTQADRGSLTDKTYKMAYTYKAGIYMNYTNIPECFNSLTLITRPPPDYSCSTSLRDYFKHTYTGNTRQPELNSRVPRVHPPYRGMPFRAQLEECYVLNPYPELNSRNPAISPLKQP